MSQRNVDQGEAVKQDLVNFVSLTTAEAETLVAAATPEAIAAMAQAGNNLREKRTAVLEALDNLRQLSRAQLRADAEAPAPVEVIAGQMAKAGDQREQRIHPPPRPLVSPLADRADASASPADSSNAKS